MYLALGGICAAGIVLRWMAGGQSLTRTEILHWANLHDNFQYVLQPHWEVIHAPVQYLLIPAGGILRWPFVLVGVASLVLLFACVRHLSNARTGLLVAGLFAVAAPLAEAHSQAITFGPAQLGILLGLYSLLKMNAISDSLPRDRFLSQAERSSYGKRIRVWAIALAFSSAVASYAHPTVGIWLFALIGLFVVTGGLRKGLIYLYKQNVAVNGLTIAMFLIVATVAAPLFVLLLNLPSKQVPATVAGVFEQGLGVFNGLATGAVLLAAVGIWAARATAQRDSSYTARERKPVRQALLVWLLFGVGVFLAGRPTVFNASSWQGLQPGLLLGTGLVLWASTYFTRFAGRAQLAAAVVLVGVLLHTLLVHRLPEKRLQPGFSDLLALANRPPETPGAHLPVVFNLKPGPPEYLKSSRQTSSAGQQYLSDAIPLRLDSLRAVKLGPQYDALTVLALHDTVPANAYAYLQYQFPIREARLTDGVGRFVEHRKRGDLSEWTEYRPGYAEALSGEALPQNIRPENLNSHSVKLAGPEVFAGLFALARVQLDGHEEGALLVIQLKTLVGDQLLAQQAVPLDRFRRADSTEVVEAFALLPVRKVMRQIYEEEGFTETPYAEAFIWNPYKGYLRLDALQLQGVFRRRTGS